ncbi:MAG: (2Fe-2S)-binding protein [Candidatus Hydrogenedentes bacterium]|nr:(2Fe-2S)-binding protein [Candidatus Hydrogenedentota bacterium]
MPTLTIDGKTIDVAEGCTVMEAARSNGIEIPALCHVPGVHSLTSCMVCVVKDIARNRLLPSCSAPAEDGMDIDTRGADIFDARRRVLEMLLSEHVGDCEAPCRHICPASLDVSAMMARIGLGDYEGAGRIAREHLVLPATLGYVCTAPCQRGCHRAATDMPLQIRELHRVVAESSIRDDVPECAPPTNKRVAIVGASAAGLAAAYVLLRHGHSCTLYDKAPVAGRVIREYAEESLDPGVLDAEIGLIQRMGARFILNCQVGLDISVETLRMEHDAIIVACDDLEPAVNGVFYAIEYPMTVNAVAEGKAAAHQALHYLNGTPVPRAISRFNSKLGELRPGEVPAFLTRLDPIHDAKKTLIAKLLKSVLGKPSVKSQSHAGDTIVDDPQQEASWCMHCECLKPVSCRLRQYATDYAARQDAFRLAARANVAPASRYDRVVFEPGKCIKCGLCVEVSRNSKSSGGMAFEGRSYSVRVKPPFEQELEEALASNAERCVRVCPTGALAFRLGEVHPA